MLERALYGGDRVINSNGPEFDTAERGICSSTRGSFCYDSGWVSLLDVGSTASGKSNVNNALSLAGNLCA